MTNLPAGRELDALVAQKIFGCRVERTTDKDGHLRWADCRCEEVPGHYLAACTPYPHKHSRIAGERYLKEYSTDIAAAWEVLEKLNQIEDGGIGISMATKDLVKGPWVVTRLQYHDFDVLSEADTAPLAICRAALEAVGHA